MIIVFGAINMELSFDTDFPKNLENTVLCTDYGMNVGGKGANQALAASIMGEKVALIGRVGDDSMGIKILDKLRKAGVITSGVAHSKLPTSCMITANNIKNEGPILIAKGANTETSADQVPKEVLGEDNILLLQTELSRDENWELVKKASELGTTTALNLAPAIKIPQRVLDNLDYLIINSTEARQISDLLHINLESNQMALAEVMSKKGKLTCIVTLGNKGSIAHTREGETITVPALKIDNMADHSGADDAYSGTFVAALHANMDVQSAMQYASVAASLSCCNSGTQESFADKKEIKKRLPEIQQSS
jgi:ribokinase